MKIKVWTKDYQVYVGNLLLENDSLVISDNKKLALSNILKIKDLSDQKTGGVLLGVGILGTGILYYALSTGTKVTPSLLPAIQGVVLIGIIGGTIMLISDRIYK